MRALLTGGCQCGRVRYRLDGPLIEQVVCACRMCQRASGGPFMAFAGVAPGDLVWTGAEPRWFASSSIVKRGFCSHCGTPVAFAYQDRAAIYVTMGTLDTPDLVAPDALIHAESLPAWVHDLMDMPWFVAPHDPPSHFENLQDQERDDASRTRKAT